jgi:hypothetical protein
MDTWLHCLWACGEAEHHGEEHMVEQSCSPHGGQDAKEQAHFYNKDAPLKPTKL